MTLTFELTGQLVSGKNQVQLLWRNGRMVKYPNQAFKTWRSIAKFQISQQRPTSDPAITRPVRLIVEYFPGDLRTRDVSGQMDALFHLLVHAKVLKDDGLVHDVHWSRQELSRKFPKVWMQIHEIEA